MNTGNLKLITAGLATAMIVPAFALEAPADDAPPPVQAPASQAAAQPASLPTFKLPPDKPAEDVAQPETAFLGVVSGEVPAILAEHLEIADGQGVLVRALCPDSPAEKSGIAVNDVITAVAGKPISTQSDLSREITRNKPGDTVELEVIHKGKSNTVSILLANKPANLAKTGPITPDQMNLDSLPKEMADHIRDALGGMELKLGQGLDADMDLPPEIEDAIGAIQKRMLRGGAMLDQIMPPEPAADASVQTESSATFRMMDNDGSIEVTSTNGSKEVTVRDQQEGTVWSGPWNTEAERAAAPPAVQERMKSLNLDTGANGNGLKFNFNGKAAGH